MRSASHLSPLRRKIMRSAQQVSPAGRAIVLGVRNMNHFRRGVDVTRLFAFWLAIAVIFCQSFPAHALTASELQNMMPLALNLASTHKTSVAPQSIGTQFILSGGHDVKVVAGTALTPAQMVALEQLLASGTQSIVLGPQGNAVGGSFVLPNSEQVSSLTVPHGVNVVRDFAGSSALNLSGDLINSGTIFAISTNSNTTTASISADAITNTNGALLTTVLPSNGLAGFPSAISNLSLSLSAHDFLNAGTISSAGDLTLASPGRSLAINNSGGTLSATGSINLTDAATACSDQLNVYGGNLLSQQVNVNAGKGALNLYVDQLTGLLNVTAGSSNVFATNSNLNLGAMHISGDPTFFCNGTMMLTGNINVQETLTLLATQDIDLGGVNILAGNSGASSNQGFDVTIIAGAKLTPTSNSAGDSSSTVGPFFTGSLTNVGTAIPGKITVSAPNPTTDPGGSINCTGCTISSASGFFNTPIPKDNNAGNILLAAYAGTAGGGNISLGSSTLNAASEFAAKGGNVTIIAPGNISLDNIGTEGVTPGNITVVTATPSGTITADSHGHVTGALSPGQLSGGGIMLSLSSSADIDASPSVNGPFQGGKISFTAGNGFINLGGGTISSYGGVGQGAGSNNNPGATGPAGQAGGKGGTIDITTIGTSAGAGGPIITFSTTLVVSVDGGIGGDGGTGGAATASHPNGGSGGAGGPGGAAGSISISAPDVFIPAGNLITAIGGNGGAGIAGQPGFSTATGNGGSGGAGGAGGEGGNVSIKTTDTGLTTPSDLPMIQANGGSGIGGGAGGSANSMAATGKGGNGGNSGQGGAGGVGGTINLSSAGLINLLNFIDALGGTGGNSLTAGNGGQGALAGGAGGNAGNAGAGGVGGKVTVTAQELTFGDGFSANTTYGIGAGGGIGGDSGAGGNGAGDTGTKSNAGNGGNSGTSGAGGTGGAINISITAAANAVAIAPNPAGGTPALSILCNGSSSGNTSNGGSGGNSTGGNGGLGGIGGNSGSSGNGGTIAITADGSVATDGGTNTNGKISADAAGSQNGEAGGEGGTGGTEFGGTGGKGGSSGFGGNGGRITITAQSFSSSDAISTEAGSRDRSL